MMVMMMCVTRAPLRAELLNVLLDSGEIRLGCRGVTRFQILRQLRNGGSQRTAALRAGCRRQQRALLSTGKKLLKRREIALRLGQVPRLQILSKQLKSLFKLLLVRILIGGRSNLPENAAGNSKNSHACFLFSGGLDANVVA